MPSIGGVWWKHLPHDGDPLHHADPPSDGRWQRGGTIAALYFAEKEETEALWRAGARAILYESAAHPGNRALCVFATDEGITGLRPIPPPQIFDSPPPAPPRTRT